MTQVDLRANIEHSPVGKTFVTPSGRRWQCCARRDMDGRHYMVPIGWDTFSGGGVRGVYVDPARLDGNDRVWKLA